MIYTILYRENNKLFRVKITGYTIEGVIEIFREKDLFKNVRIVSVGEEEKVVKPIPPKFSDLDIKNFFNGIFK